MSEYTPNPEETDEQLEALWADFTTVTNKAEQLITHPDHSLHGLTRHAPTIEADIPLGKLEIDGHLYERPSLHLKLFREIPRPDAQPIHLLKKVLGPVPFVPIRKPNQNSTIHAISASLRDIVATGPSSTISPIPGYTIDVHMNPFSIDLYEGIPICATDIDISRAKLEQINILLNHAKTQVTR